MKRLTAVCLLGLLPFAWNAAGPVPACAAEGKAFLDEKEAGEDFQLQGEYEGTVRDKDGEHKLGAQVIAQGKGLFQGVAYPGGLPGAGWDGSEKIPSEGRLDGGVVRFTNLDRGSGELRNGVITIRDREGREIGLMKRVVRKSPTLGKAAPEGAVVLFDGQSADKWQNGKVENGLLVQGITSKDRFDSFTLHMEFLLSFMPEARGQGRSNSGCYMQGRYEVQILDSFGLEGKNNECGGIYTIKDPAPNMCFPPLSWQTYDVEYTAATWDGDKKVKNATMTVWHNGVKIQDNVDLTHATTASPLKEGPEPGPIYIQDHGNPVRFRNIWIVPKK